MKNINRLKGQQGQHRLIWRLWNNLLKILLGLKKWSINQIHHVSLKIFLVVTDGLEIVIPVSSMLKSQGAGSETTKLCVSTLADNL